MSKLSEEQWQVFSERLGEALQLSVAEREAWLASLAASQPEVAAEIQLKLAARDSAGFAAFLSGSPFDSGYHADAALTGRQVGPYEIESEIGRGGMGSVWRARRTDGRFEGKVAIKFVHTYWLGRAGEERFRAEGRLLGRLDHPNIARLIDAGVLNESQPYLVLEYVEGESIDEYCARMHLDVEARVALFRDVLAAVGHAHNHLIIHRDLKPSNIFVTREGVVKLLDFGIAKLLSDDASLATTHTSAQALTPQYAAPEQLLGEPVTTATDVYALGLVLYLLLTGEPCVRIAGRTNVELIRAAIEEQPTRPSAVEGMPLSTRRALQGDLDNILGKALKKNPAERYASVGALSDDLRRFLSHEPVRARPDTVPYRLAKFVRRNRGGVMSGVLIALGLIGTSAFAIVQMFAARAQRDVALFEGKRANSQADLLQYILDDKLSQLSADAERERLDRAREFVRTRFQTEPVLAARLLIDVSGRYIDIGEFQTAADVIVEAEGIGRRFDDADVVGQIACLRTEDLAIARDYPAARSQLAIGLTQMKRLHPPPVGIEAECATAEAFVVQADGHFDRAIAHLRATVADLDAAGMHGAARYLASSNDLARAYLSAGQYRSSWEVANGNIELGVKVGRANTYPYLVYVTNACAALREGGQPRNAIDFLDSKTSKMRQGADYSDMPASTIGCRGLAQLDLDAFESAEAAILEAQAKAEHGAINYAASLYRAAAVMVAIARGDLPTAEARWAPLALDEEHRLVANQTGVEVVRLLLVHARMDVARQHPDEALKSLDRAAAIIRSRHQPTNPDARELEALRSTAYFVLKDYAAAKTHAQAAIELARVSAVDPTSSYWGGEALLMRARAEGAIGEKNASATAKEALPHLTDNLNPSHPLIVEARKMASL